MKLRYLSIISYSLISVFFMAIIVSIVSGFYKYISISFFGNELKLKNLIIITILYYFISASIEDFLRIYIIKIGTERLLFHIREMCLSIGLTISAFEIFMRLPNDVKFFIFEGYQFKYVIIPITMIFLISLLKISLHILLCKIEYINFLEKKYFTLFIIILCHGMANTVMYFAPYIIQPVTVYQSEFFNGTLILLFYVLTCSIFLIFIKYMENNLPSYAEISNKNKIRTL
jgi:hypothetical protein